MPKLNVNMEMEERAIGGGQFTFSAARIDSLGASEYTLVTIAVDVTGSTYGFADDLRASLVSAVESCRRATKQSGALDRILIRVVQFSTSVGGVAEIHGFVPLVGIDVNDYPIFNPNGMTPLCDAAYSSVGAMADYGADLMAQDYLANGIVFVITDGADNASTTGPQSVRQLLDSIRREEKLESIISVLIGINAQDYARELENFRQEAGFDQYIDAGGATKSTLAKLANFVSQSVSSQSQALGQGGPSQNISATI